MTFSTAFHGGAYRVSHSESSAWETGQTLAISSFIPPVRDLLAQWHLGSHFDAHFPANPSGSLAPSTDSSTRVLASAPPSMAPELCLNPASVVGVLPAYLDLIRTSWWLKIGSEVRLPRLESQSHHLFVTCGSCCLTFLHL